MNTQQVVIRNEEETREGMPANYDGGTALTQSSLAVSLARAEVDQQVTTARALPRSIQRAVNSIMTLATLDEESAAECVYAVPRGGKIMKGPSIRLAEIVATSWGNCRDAARVVHVDRFEKYVEAEAVFHDLETNRATTARVKRSIADKHGRIFKEDMIIVTGQAACSIARRNAIMSGVPKGIWRKAYEAVESVIAGDVKTLSSRRDKAMHAFASMGVTQEQIFHSLGVEGVEDIGLDHLSNLTAARSALKSGEATIEELFPKPDAKGNGGKMTMAERLGALAKDDSAEDNPSPSPHTDLREEAAEGRHISSERRAGSPTIGPEGDPAPVPQHEPAGSTAAVTSPDPGASSGGAASVIATADAAPSRKAEIRRDGDARAAAGTAALTDFLEGLRKAGEADLVSTILRDQWREVAKAVDAAKGRK